MDYKKCDVVIEEIMICYVSLITNSKCIVQCVSTQKNMRIDDQVLTYGWYEYN